MGEGAIGYSETRTETRLTSGARGVPKDGRDGFWTGNDWQGKDAPFRLAGTLPVESGAEHCAISEHTFRNAGTDCEIIPGLDD